ncbi:hypothetical protein ACW9HC_33615 [Nocardia gipuzkoensis]
MSAATWVPLVASSATAIVGILASSVLAWLKRARIRSIDHEFEIRELAHSEGPTRRIRGLLYDLEILEEKVIDGNITSEQAFAELRRRIEALADAESLTVAGEDERGEDGGVR